MAPNIKVLTITLFKIVFPSKAFFNGSNKKNIKKATIISKNNILRAYLLGSVMAFPYFCN